MPEWLKRLTKTDIRNSLAILIDLITFIAPGKFLKIQTE